jgi:hypothetical protein
MAGARLGLQTSTAGSNPALASIFEYADIMSEPDSIRRQPRALKAN